LKFDPVKFRKGEERGKKPPLGDQGNVRSTYTSKRDNFSIEVNATKVMKANQGVRDG